MSLGNNLLNLRKKKGLSQEEVAEILNVSRQTISKWETDQSQPDFDKIRPLCELYELTADELLFNVSNEKKDTSLGEAEVETVRRKKKAMFISSAIFLYFISIVWVMISIPVLMINPIVASSIFLVICGMATYLIVYSCMVYKKNVNMEIKDAIYKKSPILKIVYMIVSLVFLCAYLLISFKTMAWHITWILWIVYSIALEVVKLIYMLVRGVK